MNLRLIYDNDLDCVIGEIDLDSFSAYHYGTDRWYSCESELEAHRLINELGFVNAVNC